MAIEAVVRKLLAGERPEQEPVGVRALELADYDALFQAGRSHRFRDHDGDARFTAKSLG